MKDYDNEIALEMIKEFANIGAGNAATALASLLDLELVNEVTMAKMLPLGEVADWLGGPQQVVAGTYTQLCGELRSGVLVVFPRDSANTLVGHLSKEDADLSQLTQMQESALCEAGNICLCWYLVAVSKMIDTDMIPAAPCGAVDLLGAVLDIPLAVLGVSVDQVIAVHTVFRGIDRAFEGYFLLLPEKETLKTILDKMGDQYR